MQGRVQVYTGDGKCKTTAALGLAVRAVGAGMRVFLGQFIKRGDFSEIKIMRERFPEIDIEQFGQGRFIRGAPAADEIAAARHGLERLAGVLRAGGHELVIADEANNACAAGLFPAASLLALIDARPPQVELVFTGRNAPPELIARADLVSEMRCIKHYYDAGVHARLGIEM